MHLEHIIFTIFFLSPTLGLILLMWFSTNFVLEYGRILKLKKTLKLLVKEIYSDVLVNNPNFKFYLTKNGNSKTIKIKTETT